MSLLNIQTEKRDFSSLFKRSTCRALVWLCVISGALESRALYSQTDSSDSKTTFLVVRHAERDGDLDKLTKTGEERSQLLASIGTALNVQAIYSTDTKRTRGTAQPLSTAVDTKIRTYRTPSEDWIDSIQKNHSGQVVLIVGHSNTAGVIAGLLANEKSFEIAHDEYDALFVVQVSDSGTQSMRLRYGDSSEGAASAAADKMGLIESTQGAK